MDSSEEVYGSLLFFRKNGQPSTTCQLSNRKTTIGSSKDADIRFMNNKRLEEIHCIIEVNDLGIATLVNKSILEPVKVNNICIRKNKILKVDDEIELAGKKFVYRNENISKEDSDKHRKSVKKTTFTPSKKRHSLIDLKIGKKSPSFKTKIPVQMRPSTRRCASTSSDFTVTYEMKPDKSSIPSRSKTTSKVVVSKARGSPGSSKKRRLSFGDQPNKIDRNPKMSTRNILLNKNIISTITEEKFTSPKLSISMAKLDKSVKENDAEWNQSLHSDELSEDLIELNLSSVSSSSPIMSSSESITASSPRRSSSRISFTKRRLPEGRISKSPRKSLLQHCLQKNRTKSLPKSRESLRKSKNGDFSKQFSSAESPISVKPSRHSLRKSNTIEKKEEEQLEEQSSSEESEEFDTSLLLRKSKTDRIIDECKETQLSSEEIFLSESRTPNTHMRKSRQLLNNSKIVNSPDSRESLRNSKTGEFNKQFPSKEFPVPNNSSRYSSRKSKTIEEKEQNKQSSSEEDEEKFNTSLLLRKSATDRLVDECTETQFSSEESLFTPESRTPNKHLKKSRQSLNSSKIVKSPNSTKSLRNSKTGEFKEQFSNKEFPTPNNSSRHPSRKSKTIEEAEEQQLELFLTDESEEESDLSLSLRRIKTDKKIDEQYERQSSNEESLILPESHTPNKYSRKSRHSLNNSKTMKSPNESVTKSATKSRQSLKAANTSGQGERRQSEQKNESPIFDVYKSPSPSTSTVRTRQSLMRHSVGDKEKLNESSREPENISGINALATPSQRTPLKINSAANEGEHNLVTSRRLSVNLTQLQTPNAETPKETRSSVRNSNRFSRNEETLKLQSSQKLVVNVSTLSTPNETSVQRRSTISKNTATPVRKTNGVSEDEELSSSELLFLNVSPKEIVMQKLSTPREKRASSVRKSNKLNESQEELSSHEEFYVSNSSPMNTTKERSMRPIMTPKEALKMRESLMRRSYKLNKEEQSGEQTLSEESLDNIFTREISKQTPSTTPKEIRTSLRKSRASSIRNSNTLNKDKEIGELSFSENSLGSNNSANNTPKEKSEQSRVTVTPKDSSLSLRKSNVLYKDEEVGEQPSSEESFILNISAGNSSDEISIQKFSATPKGAVVSAEPPIIERRSSVRKSNRLNINEENDEISSLVPIRTSTERTSVRKSNKLNEDVDIGELSSSETFLDPNISSKDISDRRCLTMTPKQMSPLVRTSKERRSSARKSKSVRDKEIWALSPGEELFASNDSALNTPKEKLIQSYLTTPNESTSSARKSNRLSRKGIDDLSSNEESFNLRVSTVTTPKEKSLQRRATATPKEVYSVKESRSSLGKINRSDQNEEVGEQSSSEESFILNVSPGNCSEEISMQKFATTPKGTEPPKERESSVRKSNMLNTNEESDEITSLVPIRMSTERRSSVRMSNKLHRDVDIGEVSSNEVFLSPNISSKELSAQRCSTMTPKQKLSLARTPKERSSVRKNKSARAEEIGTVSPGKKLSVSSVSALNTPKETSIQRHLTTPNDSKSSMKKSNRLNQESDDLSYDLSSSNEESLNLSVSTVNTPIEKSIRQSTIARARESSVRKNTKLNKDDKIAELSSSENSLVSSVDSSVEEAIEKQSSAKKRRARMNESRYSNRDSSIFYLSNSRNSTPIPASHKNNVANKTFEPSIYSSQDESELFVESPQDRVTPKLRHSAVKKSHLNTQEEGSETETSFNKSRSSTVSTRGIKSISAIKLEKAPLTRSKQNISVITLNDSVELTPENNTSVIFIDGSFENTQKSPHKKRLSKTLNSTLKDDAELTTPKSAIKGRRTKSLTYKPLVEEITPVTPLSKSKSESGFKTPLNTPGLFEDIKKSVLRSRSQMQKSSTNLMQELNKSEPKRGVKRPLVEESYVEPSKRRKIVRIRTSDTFDTSQEDDRSFESFSTEDGLTDISEANITQNTPKHFSDLTDKPVITHPQIRSLTEPKRKKSKLFRNSVDFPNHSAIDGGARDETIESQTSSSVQDDSIFETTTSDLSSRRSSLRSHTEESDLPIRVQQRTTKNDLSDVAGLKKLLKTPREIKSPKNDLTNVPNLRRLMSPKINNSPRNDLTNIIGVKKLLATPKQMKSPKNDLRKIPNLRKLISPKQQNSPKNDLRNVPNLRKLMSPQKQNSPKNDLTDVGGVKKLFSTPKYPKSPKNDLTDVPNLRRIMSPRQQNTPNNDLTDVHGLKEMMATPKERKELQNELTDMERGDNIFNVSGVQRLSIESDIENNEDLFDRLFVKKPLRTYKGKSLSPASRKSMMFDDKRKTLGDVPYTSPRVEKWIEEQTIIKLRKGEETHVDGAQGTPIKHTIIDNQQESQKRRARGRRMEKEATGETSTSEELTEDKDNEMSHNRAVRGKTIVQETLTDDVVDESKENSVKKGVRSRNISPFVTEENEVGNKRKINDEPDVKLVMKSTRSRRKIGVDIDKRLAEEHLEKRPKARQATLVIDGEQSHDFSNTNESEINRVNSTSELEFKLPQVTRGRAKKMPQKDEIDQIPEVHSTTEDIKSPAPKRGNRAREIDQDENIEVLVSSPRRGGRLRNIAQVEKLDTIESKELPQPKRQRGKRKSPARKDNESGTKSDAKSVETEEAHPKRGRARKAKVVNEKEQTGETDNIPVITKRTRGHKQNVVVAPDSNSEIADIEETAQNAHQTKTEVEISKVETASRKRKVGRNMKKESENEDQEMTEAVRSTRGRKQPVAAKVTEVVKSIKKKAEETSHVKDDVEIASGSNSNINAPEVKISKVEKDTKTGKRKVGRNVKKIAETDTEGEDQKLTESVKSTRARNRPTAVKAAGHENNEENDQVMEVKSKKAEETSNMKYDVEMEPSKPTSGRKRLGKETDQLENSEKGENESTEVNDMEMASARPTRGKKRLGKAAKKVEEKEDNRPVEGDDMETVSSKPTRGKKQLEKVSNKFVESEKEETSSTEVDDAKKASVKPTRGKRRLEKATSKLEETEKGESESIEVDDKEMASARPTRGRKQLGKVNNKLEESEGGERESTEVDDKDMASARPTRGRKQLGKVTNKSEESEEGESRSTEVDDKDMASARPTRGRKRTEKTTNKLIENEETEDKKVSRSKKKPAEEMKDVEEEKTTVGIGRGRKPKAVDQAKLVEDCVPVDSPRTARAKRGNYNKYGSEFLTPQGKKQEKKDKKRVRFEEETKSPNEQKGRNVAKTEEVEETVRKSKRARK